MIRFVTKHIIGMMTITVIFMSCYAFCQKKTSIINQRVLGQFDCSFFFGSKFEPQIISMPSWKILHTQAKYEIIFPKNVGAQVAMDFT